MLTLPPLHFSTLGWLAVTGGAFGIGLNKGGLTGLGILPVVLFAFIFQARQSTGFVLPLLIVGDICAVITYRRVVLWKTFWVLLPPALVGSISVFCIRLAMAAPATIPMRPVHWRIW